MRSLSLKKRVQLGGKEVIIFKEGEYEIIEKEGSAEGLKEIWASGTILDGNSSGRFFRYYLTDRSSTDGLGVLYKVAGIGDDKFGFRYFTGPKKKEATKGKYYQGVPFSQLKNPTAVKLTPIENFYNFAAQFGNCRNEGAVDFRGGKKPELLLQTILKHFSNTGDLVLDSFIGSGSTGAVAHKMGRKYIGIEMGEQAYSHVRKRLVSVVDGSDQTGISKAVGWKGGGGFKFYELAPSFVTIDEFGNPVIDSYYNDTKLIRAMCKLTNHTFAPDPKSYWKQGRGQGNNSIYVTTQMLSVAMVQQIVRHLSSNETLLICPKKYEPGCEKVDTRVTIKKIPQSILKACHYGKKEYLLPVKEKPIEEIEIEDDDE